MPCDMTRETQSSKAQSEIDANLRRAYDEVTNQDIPERFRDLLSKLRADEGDLGKTSATSKSGEREG